MSIKKKAIHLNFMPLSFPETRPDLQKIGRDIFNGLVRLREGTTYKRRVRQRPIDLKPDARYRPAEVAVLLGVSYDTALRRMQKMKGCVDMGTKTKRYKRGKKLLTVSGKDLQAFLRSKTVD